MQYNIFFKWQAFAHCVYIFNTELGFYSYVHPLFSVNDNHTFFLLLFAGNIGSAFSIDPIQGSIMVAKPLDRKLQTDYHLVVRATDGGNPALSSEASVHVIVTMADNAPPRFQQEEYTTEIEENKEEGAFVAVVSAVSQSSVIYEIIRGDPDNMFTVNPNSGVVSTSKVLDFESSSFFNLTVKGTNMLDSYGITTLLVHVIDENDNRPVFTQKQYIGNVSEAATVGSVVLDNNNAPLVVKAVDADTNLNALLVYHIVELESREMFAIDTTTGAIRTKVTLDHEAVPMHEFTVQVSDMGQPQQSAETAAKVTIHIADINDSPPVFDEQLYEAKLLLPTYEDVAVVAVKASDKDSGVNSKLVYTISGGDEERFFKINRDNGLITVRTPNRLRHSYELTVSVSDGTYENICMVKVAVEHTQSNGLHFSKLVYEADIAENRTGIDEVTVVTAVGHALNEHITFSILNPTEMFKMGSTSGVVQTTGVAFDREERENYTLVIEVSDQRQPARVAHALIRVRITDENDNVPMFVNLPYFAVASIDARRGEVIKKVNSPILNPTKVP